MPRNDDRRRWTASCSGRRATCPPSRSGRGGHRWAAAISSRAPSCSTKCSPASARSPHPRRPPPSPRCSRPPSDPDPRIDPRFGSRSSGRSPSDPRQRHASAAEMRVAMLAAIGETEDSLASVLRSAPPRDHLANLTGPYAARAAAQEAQTQSVEGQSVAHETTPRRRGGWMPVAASPPWPRRSRSSP